MYTEPRGPGIGNGRTVTIADTPDTHAANGQSRALMTHLRDLVQETTTLFHQEVELARAEINQKVDQARTGLASMAVAGALTFAGILTLLSAAVFALGLVMDLWLASLIVGGGITVLGLIIFGAARAALSADKLKPDRTLRTLRRDAELAKEQAR